MIPRRESLPPRRERLPPRREYNTGPDIGRLAWLVPLLSEWLSGPMVVAVFPMLRLFLSVGLPFMC